MPPASLLAEALRHQETLTIARERLAAAAHVATHYRAIRLPALTATTARISAARKQPQPAWLHKAQPHSD